MVPVFIGGCDRSGTTFLGDLLGAHSACLTVPESQFKTILMPDSDKSASPFNPNDLVKRINDHWRFKIWKMPLDSTVPATELGNSFQDVFFWLVRQYGNAQGKDHPDFWIDHTPNNLRFGKRLLQHFPEAKFIHIVRDGRAVAASVMKLDWGPNSIISAARWWSENLATGLAAEVAFPAERIVRVRYEDLVRQPEIELQRLCDFLRIVYEPSMKSGGGFQVSGYTAQQHTLVGKAPNPARLEAWREEISPRQIEIFENITSDLLSYLGYELHHGVGLRPATKKEKLAFWVREMSGRQTNRLRYYKRARHVKKRSS